MKTIVCTVTGSPHVGDDLRICASASGGGRTDAPYIVTEQDFWRDAVLGEDISQRETVSASKVNGDGTIETVVRVKLSPAETLARVAKGIATSFAKQFSSDLATAKAKRSVIYISCSGLCDDWRLYYGTAGDNKGTGCIEIVDLMADDDGPEEQHEKPVQLSDLRRS